MELLGLNAGGYGSAERWKHERWYMVFRPGDVVVAVVWVNDMMRSRRIRGFG